MAQTVKFTISDENYAELSEKAAAQSQTVQDYVRSVLFPETVGQVQITPDSAVKLALRKYKKGEIFTVPEIFGDDWNLETGYAGIFGRRFNEFAEKYCSDTIECTNTYNKKGHMIYKLIK